MVDPIARGWSAEDAAAFREMYRRLRRFAGAVGPWEVEPEDLLQEALARVLRRGPLSAYDHPEAYLRRAIVNLARSHIRRRHAAARAHARAAAGEPGAYRPPYPSDLADLLALDPLGRAVLYLHDVEGHSFAAIAGVLGIPDGTCRQIASRSRRRLRRLLEQEAL